MTTTERAALLGHYAGPLGFAVVPIPPGTKGPTAPGWNAPANTITTLEHAESYAIKHPRSNFGVLHSASNTAALDIDDEGAARQALAALGIDLAKLLAANPYRIKGRRGEKPLWRIPDGLSLGRHALSWPKQDGATKANGQPEVFTIFELRAGAVQDVLPPSVHPDGMAYTWAGEVPPTRGALPELPAELLRLWENWAALEPYLTAACPWAPQATSQPVQRARSGDGESVIFAFNDRYSPGELLERNGYKPAGVGRWCAPDSASGQPGVLTLPAVSANGHAAVYSHHGSDVLGNGKPHDSFSVYTLLEHGGDVEAATKAAAELLGMGYTGGVAVPTGAAHPEPDWPAEPGKLPPPTPPVPELDPALLPAPLRPWLADMAERASIPLEFAAVPAVLALASVVGRALGIRPKRHDDWIVIPNLWGGIIGPPGVLKSPAIKEAIKPLSRLAAQAREAFLEQARDAEATRELLEIEVDALKNKAKDAAKKGQHAADFQRQLADKKAELSEARVTERRYLTSDVTIEKLGELFAENPRGLLLNRDELAGWLAGLERSGREGDREFYLETWNGDGEYRFDRIGRGSIPVAGMCLSVVGGIQPGKLRAYIREALAGGDGSDGLLQRLQLVVWPDRVGAWRNVDRYPDTDAKNRAFAIFEKLDALDPAELGATIEEDEVPWLRFAPDAQDLFDAWRAELETRLRGEELADRAAFVSHLNKYRKLMPALALLLHLVDWADGAAEGAVSLDAARRAAWCDFLEAHAVKVYSAEGPHASAHTLAVRVKAGDVKDGATVRDLYRRGWEGLGTQAAVYAAAEVLAEVGWLRLETQDTGGRPSQVLRLHPTLRGDK